MKKFSKLGFIAISASTVIAAPALSAGCSKKINMNVTVKTAGYSDSVAKLIQKDITVTGAWSDAVTVYGAKKFPDEYKKVKAIGVTDFIQNDGIQARGTLKADDVKGVQQMFINVINEAAKQAKGKPESATSLTWDFGKKKDGKTVCESIFKIYNHDGYSAVALDAELKINANGDMKKAYQTPLEQGGDYFNNDGTWKTNAKALEIQFIPSGDATIVKEATAKLEKYINETLKFKVKITVSSNYNAAAQALSKDSIDIAFLPVDTWAKLSGKSNFIVQAGRDVQIIDPYLEGNPAAPALNNEIELINAFNHYKEFNNNNLYVSGNKSERPTAVVEGYSANLKNAVDNLKEGTLPPVGYYRSYIFARTDSEIYRLVTNAIKEQGANWKLKWDNVKQYVKFGYTSTTSSSSYTYPEHWFAKHFDGFESF
ncbi:PhnD/SsuA/transferrin family substrate-binding protein [Mycoplasma sp. Mirounga ES2805-ORL]|uniref:PhnD/SsuA/transferrin family substrate-binding protein n=1 Tax=Mycoplasma sp. Mirounga ES2805-ORL TaxID=754514 RepID=UPI00197C2067|nr:PhnD/SsuA/transferrin family substrate-binding protein [Mycoplasma sp. Mirounga ES2805-ORL]QSF13867.1 PhnD/SsuA/transferrin family substrate-binding protein [Mycoplasma sp. Mirounga ES2805-ORL]